MFIYLTIPFLLFGIYKMNLPRGIKNKNPGNLRLSGDDWRGLKSNQSDPAFFQFSDEVYGIRALAKVLLNYQGRYGLKTISEIISRYAPPTENNTMSYIESVAGRVGVDKDQEIIVADILPELIPAIIYHENGQQPYDNQTINAAIEMAA